MSLENHLNPGEEIIWNQRRHWSWLLGGIVVCGVGVLLIPAHGIGYLVIIGALWGLLAAGSRTYVVTNQRVFALSTGILWRKLEELPLEQAAVIEVREPFLKRLWLCGDLVLNPIKADTGVEASALSIENIRRPAEFRRRILEQREALTHERMGRAAALVAAISSPPREVTALPPPLPAVEAAVWYYHHRGEQRGPVSPRELRRLARDGQLDERDLVWKEGMDDWRPASRIQGLF